MCSWVLASVYVNAAHACVAVYDVSMHVRVWMYAHMCPCTRVGLSGCLCVFMLGHMYMCVCTGKHKCACISVIWACGYVPMIVYKYCGGVYRYLCVESACLSICLNVAMGLPR